MNRNVRIAPTIRTAFEGKGDPFRRFFLTSCLLLASKLALRKTFTFKELSMPEPKANILVAFYSRDGSIEALAKAISEGAREAGAEVRLRRVPDIVSTAVMAKVPGWEAFIDSLGGLWFQGKLNGKAAGAFTSTAGPHGGNETTVVSLYIPMAHLGFIIVPNGYTHEKVFQGHGTPYGSSSISGQNTAPPTADELVVAKHQGARMTQVAAALKASR
jgi:NAD(P)H dehydrogenase (quinone)